MTPRFNCTGPLPDGLYNIPKDAVHKHQQKGRLKNFERGYPLLRGTVPISILQGSFASRAAFFSYNHSAAVLSETALKTIESIVLYRRLWLLRVAVLATWTSCIWPAKPWCQPFFRGRATLFPPGQLLYFSIFRKYKDYTKIYKYISHSKQKTLMQNGPA